QGSPRKLGSGCPAYGFFLNISFQSIPEIRSLSAVCLPSLLDVNVSGISASQLLGRSVANFLHPLWVTVKKPQGSPRLKLGSG
ncbi:hypothetical protein AB1L12_19215, partial [Peribacillus frigoritolerans]|uniref:hypothetical protein n=1 Tax=Peribacillus frigoritolerans TaxID=450367 RepID=UPI0039A14F17